jgi:hypothetical protein
MQSLLMHCKNKEKNDVPTAPHCKQFTVVQDIHISRLELQRWPLEFVISVLRFGIKVWPIPFVIT